MKTFYLSTVGLFAVSALALASFGDGPSLDDLVQSPGTYTGQTLVFERVMLSGDFSKGKVRYRLTVKTPAGKLIDSEPHPKGIAFVMPFKDGDEIKPLLKVGTFQPVRIVCSITMPDKSDKYVALVSKIEVLKPIEQGEKVAKGGKGKNGKNGKGGNVAHEVVVAEGVGITGDDALKDAFRNAVRQVVGAMVDDETLVKNDEVISDKVLTYSAGIVKKYEEVSKKQEKGLVRLKIKATVEKTELVARLKAANVAVKDVDGKGLFAEVVTGLEKEKDAKALLEKCVEGFPLNCIEATADGKPEIVSRNEKGVTVRLAVNITPSSKAYEAFRRRLQPVLEKIATAKGEFTMTTTQKEQVKYSRGRDFGGADVSGEAFNYWQGFQKMGGIKAKASPRSGLETKASQRNIVVLNTHRNKEGDRTDWSYYVLNVTTAKAFESAHKDIEIKFTLLGKDGQVVAVERFSGKTHNQTGAFGYHTLNLVHVHNNSYVISPFFSWQSTSLMPATRMSRDIKLSLDELKAVQTIECELAIVK